MKILNDTNHWAYSVPTTCRLKKWCGYTHKEFDVVYSHKNCIESYFVKSRPATVLKSSIGSSRDA